MIENVLPDSTRDRNVFNDDILHYHEIYLGNCQRSRYVVSKSRRSSMFSAVLIWSERKNSYTGLDFKIHPTNVGLREEKEMEDKLGTGVTQRKDKEAELPAQEETCQLRKKEHEGHQDEVDLTVLPCEMTEEDGEKLKDKSTRRRILNWLNEIIHNYYKKKIAETYRREQEEGNQFYPCKVIHQH